MLGILEGREIDDLDGGVDENSDTNRCPWSSQRWNSSLYGSQELSSNTWGLVIMRSCSSLQAYFSSKINIQRFWKTWSRKQKDCTILKRDQSDARSWYFTFIHNASGKGLEFDQVIVTYHGQFPPHLDEEDQHTIYVALTRARKHMQSSIGVVYKLLDQTNNYLKVSTYLFNDEFNWSMWNKINQTPSKRFSEMAWSFSYKVPLMMIVLQSVLTGAMTMKTSVEQGLWSGQPWRNINYVSAHGVGGFQNRLNLDGQSSSLLRRWSLHAQRTRTWGILTHGVRASKPGTK